MSTKCSSPFLVENSMTNERTDPVPCGKCPPCKARRVSGWSFRLMQQDKIATTSMFVTLTYNTNHVPITKKGYMTLDKTDVQKFLKKLRKISQKTIKYYYCGEYGGKTMRPHYHFIIYNAEISDIENTWKKGDIHYGEVNGATIGYVLKYMSKEPKIPMHQNDDRVKEYSNMSKKLGINYLTDNMVEWHKKDLNNRVYVNLEGGKKAAMPRYFKQKLYTPEELESIQVQNQLHSSKLLYDVQQEWIKEHGENWESIKRQHDLLKIKLMHKNAEKGRTI